MEKDTDPIYVTIRVPRTNLNSGEIVREIDSALYNSELMDYTRLPVDSCIPEDEIRELADQFWNTQGCEYGASHYALELEELLDG